MTNIDASVVPLRLRSTEAKPTRGSVRLMESGATPTLSSGSYFGPGLMVLDITFECSADMYSCVDGDGGGLSRVSSSRIGRNVPRHRTFSPSTSLEPLVNDGLGKDCMVLLTCGPKPDTSLYSRRGSGFSYGLRGRWAPMAPWCVPLRRDAMPKSGTIVSRNNRIGNSYDTQLEILP